MTIRDNLRGSAAKKYNLDEINRLAESLSIQKSQITNIKTQYGRIEIPEIKIDSSLARQFVLKGKA